MTTEHSPIPAQPTGIAYLRQRLEQVALFTQDPNAPEILASGTLNPIRAIALRAVMATPGLPNFLHESVVLSGYRKAGLDILGVGFSAVTVSDGTENVRKYYRHTAGTGEQFQQESINNWVRKQDLALEHLGSYTVAQNFSIEANPLKPNESIVVARQQRIHSVGAINMFTSEGIPDEATEFIKEAQRMHETSEFNAVPDLIGRDNVLIEAGSRALKLIDPITLVNNDPGDRRGYVKVSSFLDTFESE